MASLEEIREETRIDVEYFVKIYPPSIYKEEYPNNKKTDDYYLDRSPQHGIVSSAYTPWGIKRMESWYIHQIHEGYPDYTLEYMELLIKCNPHLHNVIKTNLLENLYNDRK